MDMNCLMCFSLCVIYQLASANTTVRLVGGTAAYGAVQVTHDGATGMLCDDYFDKNLNGAHVVCRMLGFPGAKGIYHGGLSHDQHDGRFLLDNVICSGHERNIEDCRHGTWGDEDCGAGEEAGVICESPLAIITLIGGNAYTGAVLLHDPRTLYYANTHLFGFICDDSWDINSANVVCRTLGFAGAVGLKNGSLFYKTPYPYFMTGGLKCTGNESDISQCKANVALSGWIDCVGAGVAGVECSVIKGIRLVGGNDHAGAVEVTFINDTRGFICDDDWDLKDANVICKMLGYPGAMGVPDGNLFYNQSNVSFTMSKLDCTGHETSVQACQHTTGNTCTSSEVAGVNCCTSTVAQIPNPSHQSSLNNISKLFVNTSQIENIQGETNDVTLTCDASELMSTMSIITLMQISKIVDVTTMSPVVELIAGMQTPVFVNSSYFSRATILGSVDVHHDAFLSLNISNPTSVDSGKYRCVITFLDLNHEVKIETNEVYLEVWDMAALVLARNEKYIEVSDCKSLCNLFPPTTVSQTTVITPTVPSTPTPQLQYLHISVTPSKEIVGQTKNLTLRCDTRGHSSDLIVVALLQLHKVKVDGSLSPLVEMLPGGQRPVFVDDSYLTRTQVAGSMDVHQGVFLEMVIPNPLASDAGTYQCRMSFLATKHVIETSVAEATLDAFDLRAILQEVHQLEDDLQLCRGKCYCTE